MSLLDGASKKGGGMADKALCASFSANYTTPKVMGRERGRTRFRLVKQSLGLFTPRCGAGGFCSTDSVHDGRQAVTFRKTTKEVDGGRNGDLQRSHQMGNRSPSPSLERTEADARCCWQAAHSSWRSPPAWR